MVGGWMEECDIALSQLVGRKLSCCIIIKEFYVK